MSTRRCKACGRDLPITDFYRDRTKDGHRKICKFCHIERQMRRKKGPGYEVKHHVEIHPIEPEAEAAPSTSTKRVRKANGKGDRHDYTHKYYEQNKARLTAKNKADYIKRAKTVKIITEKKMAGKEPVPRLCDHCERNADGKGCFEGFENLDTLGIGNCLDYRPINTNLLNKE